MGGQGGLGLLVALMLVLFLAQLLEDELLCDGPCLAEPEKVLEHHVLLLLGAHLPPLQWLAPLILQAR